MTQNQRSIIDIQCEIRRSVLLKEISIVEISQTLSNCLAIFLDQHREPGTFDFALLGFSSFHEEFRPEQELLLLFLDGRDCGCTSVDQFDILHRRLQEPTKSYNSLPRFLLISLPSWRFEQSHFQCSFASLLIVLSQYGDFEVSSHVPVVGQLIQSTFSTKERVQNHS